MKKYKYTYIVYFADADGCEQWLPIEANCLREAMRVWLEIVNCLKDDNWQPEPIRWEIERNSYPLRAGNGSQN